MLSLTKSAQAEDFEEIRHEIVQLKEMTEALWAQGYRIDIGHEYRWWEYGRAIAGIRQVVQPLDTGFFVPRVLDVGSGWSPLGPTLAFRYLLDVLECEPDATAYEDRERIQPFLARRQARFTHRQCGLGSLPNDLYNAVCCVSVLEHVDRDIEQQAWEELAARVQVGGLLYITVDCVPDPNRTYTFDNLRKTNYTIEMIRQRVDRLVASGMRPVGIPDWEYHGNKVHDYTFFSVGLERL